jgi:hypothetical protein
MGMVSRGIAAHAMRRARRFSPCEYWEGALGVRCVIKRPGNKAAHTHKTAKMPKRPKAAQPQTTDLDAPRPPAGGRATAKSEVFLFLCRLSAEV